MFVCVCEENIHHGNISADGNLGLLKHNLNVLHQQCVHGELCHLRFTNKKSMYVFVCVQIQLAVGVSPHRVCVSGAQTAL